MARRKGDPPLWFLLALLGGFVFVSALLAFAFTAHWH